MTGFEIHSCLSALHQKIDTTDIFSDTVFQIVA